MAAAVCILIDSSPPSLHTVGITSGNNIPIVPKAYNWKRNNIKIICTITYILTDPVAYAMKYPIIVVIAGIYFVERLPPFRA